MQTSHERADLEHHAQGAASSPPARTNFPGVPEGRPLGIITIEDVIEELLQQVWVCLSPAHQSTHTLTSGCIQVAHIVCHAAPATLHRGPHHCCSVSAQCRGTDCTLRTSIGRPMLQACWV